MYNPPRSSVPSAEIICTIRRGHMYHSPRSNDKVVEVKCTMLRDHMHNSPRTYVQFTKSICTIRRDHMYHSPRSYVPFAEIIFTIRLVSHCCSAAGADVSTCDDSIIAYHEGLIIQSTILLDHVVSVKLNRSTRLVHLIRRLAPTISATCTSDLGDWHI